MKYKYMKYDKTYLHIIDISNGALLLLGLLITFVPFTSILFKIDLSPLFSLGTLSTIFCYLPKLIHSILNMHVICTNSIHHNFIFQVHSHCSIWHFISNIILIYPKQYFILHSLPIHSKIHMFNLLSNVPAPTFFLPGLLVFPSTKSTIFLPLFFYSHRVNIHRFVSNLHIFSCLLLPPDML